MSKMLNFIFLFAVVCCSAPVCAYEKEDLSVYRRILKAVPKQLDPVRTDFGHEVQVIRQMYDQLVTYDKEYSLSPMLAESWSVSKDGRVYIFKIRKGVRFSDGAALTLDDVVFSLERVIKDTESKYFRDFILISGADKFRKGISSSVAGISKSTDTVRIELESSNPYFLSILASPAGSITEKSSLIGLAYGEPPVGTGPFLLHSRTRDSLILTANPDYFRGRSRIGSIVYKIYPDQGEMTKAYLEGKLDDIAPYSLPPSANKKKFKRIFSNGIISFVIVSNPKSAVLAKKVVRQAIVMSIDFDRILKNLKVAYPNLSRSKSYIPKGRSAYDAGFSGLGYSPAKATDLIKAAGYESLKKVPPVTLIYSGNLPYSEEIISGMKSSCLKTGLECRFRRSTGMQNELADWDMKLIGLDTVYPDTYFLLRYFHSKSPDAALRRNDEKLDKLIEKSEGELNPLKRNGLFQEINKTIVDDAYVIPLYSGDIFDGFFQAWVEGVRYPITAYYDLSLYYLSINSEAGKNRPKID